MAIDCFWYCGIRSIYSLSLSLSIQSLNREIENHTVFRSTHRAWLDSTPCLSICISLTRPWWKLRQGLTLVRRLSFISRGEEEARRRWIKGKSRPLFAMKVGREQSWLSWAWRRRWQVGARRRRQRIPRFWFDCFVSEVNSLVDWKSESHILFSKCFT